jgi:L-asparaginase/Glu-tRNA(Gln) amidotransferase subunit D
MSQFHASLDVEAVSNLRWACHFARTGPRDVCVFFHDRLMAGARVQKVSADDTDNKAFDCPKTTPLVLIERHGGHEFQLWNQHTLEKMKRTYQDAVPKLHDLPHDRPVVLLRMYPGISGSLLEAILSMKPYPAAGLVLQT